MISIEDFKKDIHRIIKKTIRFAEGCGYNDNINELKRLEERFKDEKIYIVVCGEIKRGKSSFLGAFLEDVNLFPVDVNVATNIVSIVTYGEKESIRIVTGKGSEEKVTEITRDEISSYVTEKENKNNIKEARILIIETPNKKLKNGYVFIDTPGIGSMNPEHSTITFSFLPRAQGIIFTTDAISPLTSEELYFIKQVSSQCKNIVYILTKIDKEYEYEKIIKINSEKISKALGQEETDIMMVPISTIAKQKYIETGNERYLRMSNFEELDEALNEKILKRKEKILFEMYISRLLKITADIKKYIQDTINAIEGNNSNDEGLIKEYKKKITSREKILDKKSNIWESVELLFDDLNIKSLETLKEGITRIKGKIKVHIKDYPLKKDMNSFVARLQMDLNNELLNLRSFIVKSIRNICASLCSSLDINMDMDELMASIDKVMFEESKIENLEHYLAPEIDNVPGVSGTKGTDMGAGFGYHDIIFSPLDFPFYAVIVAVIKGSLGKITEFVYKIKDKLNGYGKISDREITSTISSVFDELLKEEVLNMEIALKKSRLILKDRVVKKVQEELADALDKHRKLENILSLEKKEKENTINELQNQEEEINIIYSDIIGLINPKAENTVE